MASATVGILRALLTANTAEFETAMKQAGDSARALGKDFSTIGAKATQLGTSLTKVLTVPILAVGAGAIKAAMDFESSFANVGKTVDGVADNAGNLTKAGEALAKTFRKLATEIPATTDELNKIAALGGQMGVPIEQLEKFTENVAALGVAVDGISTEEAAAGLAQIGNITGDGATKIEQYASALVHLGNNSAATEGDILEFTKRMMGTGHAVGLTVPQVMALGTAMANVGINAEAGGTAMNTVIAKMSKAVSAGGDALKEFANVAGMTGEQFAKVFRESPIEAIDAFVKGLSRARESGVDLNLLMGDLGTEGIRVAAMLKSLAGAGDGVGKSLKFANEGFSDGNKHLTEAEKKYATTANQLKVLWNQIKEVGIILGNALLPLMKDLIELGKGLIPIISRLAEGFASLPTWLQASALGFFGLLAAAGPALFIAGQLITTIGQLGLALGTGGLATKVLTAAGAFTTLKLAMVAVPIAAFAGGLVVMAAKLTDAQRAVDNANASMAKTGIVTGAAAAAMVKPLQDVGGQIRGMVKPVADLNTSLNRTATQGLPNFTGATDTAKEAAKQYADEIKKLRDQLSGAALLQDIQKLVDAIRKLTPAQLASEDVQKRLTKAIADLDVAFNKLPPTLQQVAFAIQKVTEGLWSVLPPAAKMKEAFNGVEERAREAIPIFTQFGDLIGQDLPVSFGNAKSAMEQFINALPVEFELPPPKPGFFTGWGDFISAELPRVILGAIQGGGDWVRSIGSLLGIKLGESFVGHFGKSITGLFGQTLGGVFNALIPGLGALIGPLLGKIGGWFKKLFGPSDTELAGRDVAADFRRGLEAGLNERQRAEAVATGNFNWAASVIAIRDAYLAVGRTEREALDVAHRLWEAEKQGPEAVKRVIDEINAAIQAHREALGESGDETEDTTDATEEWHHQLEEVDGSIGDVGDRLNDTPAEEWGRRMKEAGEMAQAAFAPFLGGFTLPPIPTIPSPGPPPSGLESSAGFSAFSRGFALAPSVTRSPISVQMPVYINGVLDRDSVRDVFLNQLVPLVEDAIALNQGPQGLYTVISRVAAAQR